MANRLASPSTEHEYKRAIALVAVPAGWSHRDIARKLGVSHHAIAAWRQIGKKADTEIFEYVQQLVKRVREELTQANIEEVKDKLR